MSWSSVLRKVRPQELFSSLAARPFSVAVGARLPCSVDGRALGAAVGGSGSSPLPGRSPLGDERLSVGMGAVGQCRGMAASNHRHKKILKMAKGYRGRSKSVFKIAIQKVEKALQQGYRDRKNKKRDFRRLWIERINAGVRQHGMPYSMFVNQAKNAEVELNRKVLAEMAVTEPYSFRAVVETVKATGGSAPKTIAEGSSNGP